MTTVDHERNLSEYNLMRESYLKGRSAEEVSRAYDIPLTRVKAWYAYFDKAKYK